MDDGQKLRYLQGGYFPFHIYQLFIHVVELYQEEGGDSVKGDVSQLREYR